MKNLIKAVKKKEIEKFNDRLERFEEQLKNLKDSDKLTNIEKVFLNRSTPYVKSRTSQVKTKLKVYSHKEIEKQLENIERVAAAPDSLPSDLTLIINFYKSKTWGYCPKGSDNYGHETSSITGSGYCKESTATADLLNQNDTIMKQLFKAKNKPRNLKQSNHDFLGYGSGYGITPSFEGGVGVNCHVRILESLGYKVTLSGNASTTILTVSNK